LSKKFKSDCPKYDITSDQNHFDYSIVTGHGLAVYDKSGQIVSWSDASSLSSQIKDICWSLETATVVEVVDADNLTQTSDLRGAPPAGGIAGVANEIAGRRRTHTDNATLDVIAKGEHAVLDCYEHHKGCTTIAAGKYYAAIYDGSIWISYEMPITHEHKRNHYVIAGSW